MKTLLTLALLSLSLSTFAQELLALSNPRVVVNKGPSFAAVQPTAHLEFEFNSCGKKSFSAQVDESLSQDNTKEVKIIASSLADCRAVGVTRTYRVQLSSDHAPFQKYVLLNPIPTKTTLE